MIPGDWASVLLACADPERARRHFESLYAAVPEPGLLSTIPNAAKPTLAALLAGSRALSAILVRRPDWLEIFHEPGSLQKQRQKGAIAREFRAVTDTAELKPAGDPARNLEALHDLRLRELVRIAARDLGRLGTLPEIVLEISNVADAFLDGILRVVWKQMTDRFGSPWHRDSAGVWLPTSFAILGMGKLGGQELNYSSDVDLLFVYSEEGSTFRSRPRKGNVPPGHVLSNHAFFKRVGEALIRESTSRGVQAGGLRVDMRLRPEGDTGPLARSLDAYENFYSEWGQTWERMMLLKARCIAGEEALAGEFLERVQPFRYPRALGEGIFREMAEMKARIETEVVRAEEIERNVKLGRGGIREIEFIVQSLQVLHGGRNPFLQTTQTLEALPKLAAYRILPESDAEVLQNAYPFLRDVEHRLQMDEQRQTHTLPASEPELTRIGRLMGFDGHGAFRAALSRHTTGVRSVYDRVFGPASGATMEHAKVHSLGVGDNDTAAWRDVLVRHRFRDPDTALRLLRSLVDGPGFVHVSPRTRDLGRRLIQRLLEMCPTKMAAECATRCPPHGDPSLGETGYALSDPDRVLARLDSYITAYGARASLYELWTARPTVLDHLLKLFDRSEFLAELAIRVPDMVEELESGGHLRRRKDAKQTLEDLRHGAMDPDQHVWLRRYFHTEFMRLGLRDILGLVSPEDANRELTALADACLEYALEVITRQNRLRKPPFAVIALGKFGGAELVFGSDLDILFVAPNAARNLPKLQKLAAHLVDLLAVRTDDGFVFELDTRLRPDGEKGLLVNVLKGYEDYYRGRAQLWEIQALTRARPVAGDVRTGHGFIQLARCLTAFGEPSPPLAAFTDSWKPEIARMRRRIERERTPPGMETLAFKTGRGGLVDVEFLAQSWAMAGGWFEPNTLAALRKAREAGILSQEDADVLEQNFRNLRRMEWILRRWSFDGESVLPADPAPQYRVAVRCGYSEAEPFLKDVAAWRAAVRAIYQRHLGKLV